MITIESAESALKNVYLDTVINDINTKTNPFLTMVDKNKKTVSGKEAKATVRYANRGAVTSGEETGSLPTGINGKCAEICVPLKNLYGTFQITDKAIKAAQNNPGAFADLLSAEMSNLVSTAQMNLNSMVYGNGMKFLGYSSAVNSNERRICFPKRFIGNFKAGDKISVFDVNNGFLTDLSVTSVNTASNYIVYADGQFDSYLNYDRYYFYDMTVPMTDLNGVDSLFLNDKIYNLNGCDHREIAPYIQFERSMSAQPLDEDHLMQFFDKYEEFCGCMPADILLCGPSVKKALFESLRDTRSNIAAAEMAGGFRGFNFNGIPVYSDINCKGGTVYALNSDSWAMHQLCDWTWLSGDDGSILKQADGKPIYSASLVKYADLICEKPFLQGKFTGFAAQAWKQPE